MGIYIPNMEKPENCGECFFETLDAEYKYGEWATFRHCLAKHIETDGCPLEEVDDIAFGLYKAYIDGIKPSETPKEIVRCKECMYWHEHEWYNTCDKHIGHGFPSDYFCGDGERRNDE